MRVAIISPNLLLQSRPSTEDQWWVVDEWSIDSLGKKAALLFDKLYLTHDLEVTRSLIEGTEGDADDWRIGTINYLVEQGLIVTPNDFGCGSGAEFLARNIKGAAKTLHRELVRIGNPGIDEDQDAELLGQPDIGDFVEHDGLHPRQLNCRRRLSNQDIALQQRQYESVLVRRNAAVLLEAGADSAVVVGSLFEDRAARAGSHPVWQVVIRQMPSLDVRAPWEDVLGFRREERTQHLIRSLRRWVRKIASEEWSESDLHDEVAEILFEYETHMKASRIGSASSVLRFLITGSAELAENLVKLRIGKVGSLIAATVNRNVNLLNDELKTPGHELALIPEMRARF